VTTRETGPFDLSKSPIHLGSRVAAENPAVPLHGFGFNGPAFEAYMAEHCAPGAPGRLVMIEASPTNWPAWECHTEGDELVIVLEGEGDFLQEIDGETRSAPFGPGSTFINPAGVWHTGNVRKPMRAIYLTPCPGTKHRAR
jgi:mannose-6-phosphate isomerase-like protein (cupin superfamily)